MIRLRTRIHWIASAWILSGSGCDYWRNLVEPKQADKVDLVLSVRDAWTGEALTSAWCSVDDAEALRSDSGGLITLPDASTGRKSVRCTCASFHERTLTLDALPGQGRLDIPMARMGGEHWYPEFPVRHVRIELDSGNQLFPGDMVVRGFPSDSAEGIFHYAWTSTHHSGLASLRKAALRTGPQSADSLNITLTLTVTATLAGRTYEVGTDSQSFTLSKNRPPTLVFLAQFNPLAPVRVGSGCHWEPARLFLKAVDPDGECRIRIRSRNADLPLRLIDTTAACSQYLPFVFPIYSHDGHPEESISLEGYLDVEVFDENGGKVDTSLNVTTYSNQHPYIELEQVDVKPKNLTGQEMSFRIFARDRDSKNIQVVKVDWKNGDTVTYYNALLRAKEFLEDTLKVVWNKPGTYPVEARVEDACGMSHTVVDSITLVDNKIPTVEVEGVRFDHNTKEYVIHIEANDGDLASGMDALVVNVDWGPILGNWEHQGWIPLDKTPININTQVGIPIQPVENATGYEIIVRVQDDFFGSSSDTLRLTPKEAFGLD